MSDAALIEQLRNGNAAIVATDTVYGLVARPGSKGHADIFAIKQRPVQQALPWIIGSPNDLSSLVIGAPDYAIRLADMFWPGPLTLVLHPSPMACDLGQLESDATIALRCPDDDRLRNVLGKLDFPLVCTSANLHGEPACWSVDELPRAMLDLPGANSLPRACAGQRASTIADCTGPYPSILRTGPIPEQVILDVAMFGATLTAHE